MYPHICLSPRTCINTCARDMDLQWLSSAPGNCMLVILAEKVRAALSCGAGSSVYGIYYDDDDDDDDNNNN